MIERKSAEDIERRILDFIGRSGMIAKGSKFVVAVSGGPDSVCLIHALSSLRHSLGIELHAAHLDHGLRGASSEADAAYVRELMQKMGLPATIGSQDVPAYQAQNHLSIEEAAREVRYAFLCDVAKDVGADGVAIGHTRDDNVETILMHIIRGSGTRGLRGLLPVADLRTRSGRARIVRPLLEISRRDTAAYCLKHGLEPRVDETNRSLSMFRNRIRLRLLPSLRSYNPSFDEALLRMGRIASDDISFLAAEAAKITDASVTRERGSIVLRKPNFIALSRAMKRHVLRLCFEELVGDLKDIETRHIEELLEAIDKPSGRVFHMPYGLVFSIEHDRYLLGRNIEDSCPFPPLESDITLKVPGVTEFRGWRVTASVMPAEEGSYNESEDVIVPANADRYGGVDSQLASFSNFRSHLSACFDYDRIGGGLTARPLRTGDRFEPLGLGHSKKISEFMIDARIPRSWRKHIPIIVSQSSVVWLAGWRIDERVKVTGNTKKVLTLQLDMTDTDRVS